jgi:hypothetical protein
MLVTLDTVWLGIDSFVEDISTVPGGLVSWNRTTQELHRYPLEFAVESIWVEGDSLRLQGHYGYALFRNGEVRRFLKGGRPVAKFPPPPTHY